MKKIQIKENIRIFIDMAHGNIRRKGGEIFTETDTRADDLIRRGYARLIEDLTEKTIEVETAVKAEKKEKAVEKKEKATAKKKTEEKKNAKK